MGRLAAVPLIVLLAVGAGTQANKNVKKQFEASYDGKTAVLRKPLYSIAATVTIGTRPQVMTDGTTVVSPDKGVYHAAIFGTKSVRDRDPEQLLAKGAAETQHLSMQGPKLFTYKPGTRMRIRAFLHDSGVKLLLYDELASDDEPTTSLDIEWPQRFSRDFTERGAVVSLIADFLEIQ